MPAIHEDTRPDSLIGVMPVEIDRFSRQVLLAALEAGSDLLVNGFLEFSLDPRMIGADRIGIPYEVLLQLNLESAEDQKIDGTVRVYDENVSAHIHVSLATGKTIIHFAIPS